MSKRKHPTSRDERMKINEEKEARKKRDSRAIPQGHLALHSSDERDS